MSSKKLLSMGGEIVRKSLQKAILLTTVVGLQRTSHSQTVKKQSVISTYRLSLGKTTENRSTNDSLIHLDTIPDKIKGAVVYAVTINKWPFLRNLVSSDVKKNEKATKPIFHTRPIEESQRTSSWIFDPQFSPDGRSLLFKWGDPFERRIGFDLAPRK